MKALKNLFANAANSKIVKSTAVVATGVTASVSSHAADLTTTITDISATAETNQAAIVAAVISLAAISFGVGFILKWLMK